MPGCELCQPCATDQEYRMGHDLQGPPARLCSSPRIHHRGPQRSGSPRIAAARPTTRPARSISAIQTAWFGLAGFEALRPGERGGRPAQAVRAAWHRCPCAALGQAGDVSTRAREALDEPVSNGIPDGNHHDGGRLGGMLGCHCRWCACSDDDMHVEPHQLCGEIGRAILAVVREPTVDGDILSFDPAEFLQPLPERRNHRSAGRAAEEKAQAAELCRLLASGGRAQGRHQRASDQQHDVPSSHATLASRWRPPG